MLPKSRASSQNERKRVPNAKWCNEEIASMVTQLMQAKKDGNTSDNGFKSTVWTTIANSFDDQRKYERRVVETKFSRMKKDFSQVKWLRFEASGFGWDDEKKLVTAEDSVWEELAEVYHIYCLICISTILTTVCSPIHRN
jgi:Myb/SANT-like DNA-binding domain